MEKNEYTKLVLKRTFEDCLAYQEELRSTITELIKENRCLTDEEQKVFFHQLAHATFGLGTIKKFTFHIPDYGFLTLGHVEYAARWIAIQTGKKIKLPYEVSSARIIIDIKNLWIALLNNLFSIFPIALDRSSSMSKEMDATTGGGGYEFNPED